MEPSQDLRKLYLDPAEAGTPWLLDPANSDVIEGFRSARDRTAATPCDARALGADLPDLLVLLRERHFGVATGIVDGDGLEGWAAGWKGRLATEQPTTWGAALGADVHHLRWLLGDRHVGAVGEDGDLLTKVDARLEEPVHDEEPGQPVVETRTEHGVLYVRIRQCGGGADKTRQMTDWVERHDEHFAHERIVVDVRSNPGGSEEFVHRWMAAHVPEAFAQMAGQEWTLDGRPLGLWNPIVQDEIQRGPAWVPEQARTRQPTPSPNAEFRLEKDDQPVFDAGPKPWHGRMIVLTDRRTASAGEGTAWVLRAGFGARLVGGRSMGCMTFGNLVPYLLPRSGLVLRLPTMWFGYRDVEMVGLPVDLGIDPRTPAATVTNDFDRLWEQT